MQILTQHRKFPGPRTAAGAITGTMLAGAPPWQSSHGGDAAYALDPETGEHLDIENVYGTYHGVLVQWTGGNFATGFTVAWCPCHADHPVVRAAREEGRFAVPDGPGVANETGTPGTGQAPPGQHAH